jgi:hypothetical protein
LRNFPKASVQGIEDITPRVQLRIGNVVLMVAVGELQTPMTHQGRSANLGHGLEQKVMAFFVQLAANDLRPLSVPPTMESVLATKFKLKEKGQ